MRKHFLQKIGLESETIETKCPICGKTYEHYISQTKPCPNGCDDYETKEIDVFGTVIDLKYSCFKCIVTYYMKVSLDISNELHRIQIPSILYNKLNIGDSIKVIVEYKDYPKQPDRNPDYKVIGYSNII
ncbi:hypothetical protein [Lacrimispora amygdalina]|uniref:hypothetical protein n=1 Tax=Lacrimispora amygdalina TaxID=253257 RepID=UPI000BE29189|nr:hypothetical protein [Lacrimispora amygdalina]